MKPILAFAKPIVFYLSFIMLFQSCVVYQNTTVTLDEAINTTDMRFKKIKTHDSKKYKLRRIELIEGQLYGSAKEFGELKPLGIMPNDILSIRPQDKVSSIAGTVLTVVGIVGAVALVIYVATFDLELGTMSYP